MVLVSRRQKGHDFGGDDEIRVIANDGVGLVQLCTLVKDAPVLFLVGPALGVAPDLMRGEPGGTAILRNLLAGQGGLQLFKTVAVVRTSAKVGPVYLLEKLAGSQLLHVCLGNAGQGDRDQLEGRLAPIPR